MNEYVNNTFRHAALGKYWKSVHIYGRGKKVDQLPLGNIPSGLII